jgi:FkbM family methyltransferase
MFSQVKAKIRPWLPEPVLRPWRLLLKLRNSVPKFLDGPHVLSFGEGKTGGLIYDVGLCDGGDTAFYLAKGFRVVAVEADPALAAAARRRFKNAIQTGRLTIIEKAVAFTPGRASFDVHRINPHWSSLVHSRRARMGDDIETIEVECITLSDILAEHGVPYYLKIDIEESDLDAVQSLRSSRTLPRYVSAEAHSTEIVAALYDVGYRRFKLIDQRRNNELHLWPWTWKEGRYVWTRFTDAQSGPFGEETYGHWVTREEVVAALAEAEAGGSMFKGKSTWYDFHATF